VCVSIAGAHRRALRTLIARRTQASTAPGHARCPAWTDR
jgi:hypothetical protein